MTRLTVRHYDFAPVLLVQLDGEYLHDEQRSAAAELRRQGEGAVPPEVAVLRKVNVSAQLPIGHHVLAALRCCRHVAYAAAAAAAAIGVIIGCCCCSFRAIGFLGCVKTKEMMMLLLCSVDMVTV